MADATVLAGGQSLLPLLSLRMGNAERLIDISRLAELRRTKSESAHVTIGAAVTHAEIEDGLVPDPGRGLMQRVASHIAYRAVRNQGTVGGSVAMADPAADWPLCFMALDAVVVIADAQRERREPVAEFVQDVYTTSLAPGELIVAFEIPWLDEKARTGVAKIARKSGAFAMSQAIAILNDGGRPSRVYLAGADSRAIRLAETSAVLAADVTEAALRSAIAEDLARTQAASDDYALRLHTAGVLRAVREAQEK